MISKANLKEIIPKPVRCTASPAHVVSGVPIPKAMRIRAFSSDDWEEFIEEWSTSLNNAYKNVRRLAGTGDLGVDIAAFRTDQGFKGSWDNYQCKQYDHPLRPSDVWVEIGKIIFYADRGEYIPPWRYYFVCPRGVGTTLEKLLNQPGELKMKARQNWSRYCENGITATGSVVLTGTLEKYFDAFDFSIFSSKSLVELIEGHSNTRYHAVRFGGGLPPRPDPDKPPESPTAMESRYIRQLLDAYGDHLGGALADAAALDAHDSLRRDYLRHRERFYHAESLRNFARDTVPEGTFDALQEEAYYGVIDVCSTMYTNGFERMKATVAQASTIAVTANPLSSATKAQDRQGICHQLANGDRLTWVPDNE